MRRALLATYAVVALLGGFLPASALVPEPAGAVQKLPSQAQWRDDVREVMSGSTGYLQHRVAQGQRRLAINVDIDNTMLATEYRPGAPVKPVRHFTRLAREQGVKVLVNSARRPSQLARTKRELADAGYRVDEICLGRNGLSLAEGKQRCRRHFVSEGYTLIANVGNRATDFEGGNYERAYRLPNYHNRLG